MKFFRRVASFIIMLALAGVTGCQAQKQPVMEAEISAPPSVETMDMTVYYLKDNNNEMYLVQEVHKVPKSSGVARASLNELILGEPVTPGAFKVLPKDTKILGIKIENGLATVDFSKEVLKANVGSSGEMLGIASMVNTLTEFPTIQKVKFTVEGKDDNAMGWWGHMGLYQQPFKRDLSFIHEPAIWVTSPIENQTVKNTFKIKGNARVFEAFVSFCLKDTQGNILAKGSTRAAAGAPERGDFEIELNFTPSSAGRGQLEVFEESMKDGSPINMVIIPVKW